jgi:hypothetical protein
MTFIILEVHYILTSRKKSMNYEEQVKLCKMLSFRKKIKDKTNEKEKNIMKLKEKNT